MAKLFRFAALFVALFCVIGCSAVVLRGRMSTEDRIVCLSVNIANEAHQETATITNVISENCLNVYLNGNFFRLMKSGFAAGSIDKYLKPGCNTIEIEGTVRTPVEVRLASYESDHRTINRVILSRELNASPTGAIKWKETYQIKKSLLLPIFEKKNILPETVQAEKEIKIMVKKLYKICNSNDSDEFCRMTLEGYSYHSPAEHQDVKSATEAMAKNFKLKPFPAKLQFLRGSNLVCVYTSIADDHMVLFDSDVPNSCSVGSVDFAYIDGRWIVW